MNISQIEDMLVERKAFWENQGYSDIEATEAAIADINEVGA